MKVKQIFISKILNCLMIWVFTMSINSKFSFFNNISNSGFQKRILNAEKNKIGQKINSPKQIISKGIYCLKAVHSKAFIGIPFDSPDNKLLQLGKWCPENFKFRFIRQKENSNWFKIYHIKTKKYLTDQPFNSKFKEVFAKNRSNSANQTWKLGFKDTEDEKKGYFQILNIGSRYVLDVERGRTSKNTRVITYKIPHGYSNQQFIITYHGKV